MDKSNDVMASDILAEIDTAVKQTRRAFPIAACDFDVAYLRGAHDALKGFRRLARSQEFALKVCKSRLTGAPHER